MTSFCCLAFLLVLLKTYDKTSGNAEIPEKKIANKTYRVYLLKKGLVFISSYATQNKPIKKTIYWHKFLGINEQSPG